MKNQRVISVIIFNPLTNKIFGNALTASRENTLSQPVRGSKAKGTELIGSVPAEQTV